MHHTIFGSFRGYCSLNNNKRKSIVTFECRPLTTSSATGNQNNEDGDVQEEIELQHRIKQYRLHYNHYRHQQQHQEMVFLDATGKRYYLHDEQSSSFSFRQKVQTVLSIRQPSLLGCILQFICPYIAVDTIYFLPLGILVNSITLMILLELDSLEEGEEQREYVTTQYQCLDHYSTFNLL